MHCLLSVYGLGGSPEEIQVNYNREASYQMSRYPIDYEHVAQMDDKDRFKEYMDNFQNYSSFLAFFQKEIYSKGVKAVLSEHLFANDDHANALLGRLFCGTSSSSNGFLNTTEYCLQACSILYSTLGLHLNLNNLL